VKYAVPAFEQRIPIVANKFDSRINQYKTQKLSQPISNKYLQKFSDSTPLRILTRAARSSCRAISDSGLFPSVYHQL